MRRYFGFNLDVHTNLLFNLILVIDRSCQKTQFLNTVKNQYHL